MSRCFERPGDIRGTLHTMQEGGLRKPGAVMHTGARTLLSDNINLVCPLSRLRAMHHRVAQQMVSGDCFFFFRSQTWVYIRTVPTKSSRIEYGIKDTDIAETGSC